MTSESLLEPIRQNSGKIRKHHGSLRDSIRAELPPGKQLMSETLILTGPLAENGPERTWRRLREVAVVSAIVAAASCILWWRFLPLPHGDLGYYTEPAYLLAEFGKLAGPASQYVAVVPAILAVIWQWKNISGQVRNVGLAFLGGAAVWFASNKSQLLLEHHFLFPSKSVFLGVLYSWPKLPVWARLAPLLLLCAISFYFYKADFLYLGSPLRQEEQSYAARVSPDASHAGSRLFLRSLCTFWDARGTCLPSPLHCGSVVSDVLMIAKSVEKRTGRNADSGD